MNELADLIAFAQSMACKGQRPHELLLFLKHEIVSVGLSSALFVRLEWCLMQAFDIPLRVAREIECWSELSAEGTLSSADIDTLFHSWIEAYIRNTGQ